MYRQRSRACPACGVPMEEVPVEAGSPDSRAEVERCAQCGGLFLEFFDGEPAAISRGLRKRSDLGSPGPAELAGGPLTCPDCDQPMVLRPYLGQGPVLPRCETCLAVFLTPALHDAMSRLELLPEPEEAEPSWVDRLLDWLR